MKRISLLTWLSIVVGWVLPTWLAVDVLWSAGEEWLAAWVVVAVSYGCISMVCFSLAPDKRS